MKNLSPLLDREGRRHLTLVGLVCLALILIPGCMSMTHTSGAGATGGEMVTARKWYALWGFLPLEGSVDSRTLAGKRKNYTVHTSFSGWDIPLNLVCGPLGFFRTTLEVEY